MFEPFEALSGAREGSESTHASMCPRMAPYSMAEGNAENAARASGRRSCRDAAVIPFGATRWISCGSVATLLFALRQQTPRPLANVTTFAP
jgi:hypothetical protein